MQSSEARQYGFELFHGEEGSQHAPDLGVSAKRSAMASSLLSLPQAPLPRKEVEAEISSSYNHLSQVQEVKKACQALWAGLSIATRKLFNPRK